MWARCMVVVSHIECGVVKDSDPCGLAACPGGGGHGDQGFQGHRHRQTLAWARGGCPTLTYWGVHIIQQLGVRV